jgi:hypothetical protein
MDPSDASSWMPSAGEAFDWGVKMLGPYGMIGLLAGTAVVLIAVVWMALFCIKRCLECLCCCCVWRAILRCGRGNRRRVISVRGGNCRQCKMRRLDAHTHDDADNEDDEEDPDEDA